MTQYWRCRSPCSELREELPLDAVYTASSAAAMQAAAASTAAGKGRAAQSAPEWHKSSFPRAGYWTEQSGW